MIPFASALLIAACAQQVPPVLPGDSPDLPVRRAFFPSDPSALHAAFRMGCTNPGDAFTQPNRTTARCTLLPSPEGAAFLLIEFDASLETPKLVMQKVTRPVDEGYEVEMSYYAQIRAKSGNRQRIYMQRPALDRQIDQLLESSGGVPVAD